MNGNGKVYFTVFICYKMVFDFLGNPWRVTLGSWAIQEQVAGWIWPTSCSLPVPVLKPGDLQKLQMGHVCQWGCKQPRFVSPTKKTPASPGHPANYTGLLDCSDPYLCFLSYLSLEQPRDNNGGGGGRSESRGAQGKSQLPSFLHHGFLGQHLAQSGNGWGGTTNWVPVIKLDEVRLDSTWG